MGRADYTICAEHFTTCFKKLCADASLWQVTISNLDAFKPTLKSLTSTHGWVALACFEVSGWSWVTSCGQHLTTLRWLISHKYTCVHWWCEVIKIAASVVSINR